MRTIYTRSSAVAGISLMILTSVLSLTAFTNASESPGAVIFLQEIKEPIPFDLPQPLAGGFVTIKSDASKTIEVPGCVDGDNPEQKAQFHLVKKKGFTPGGPADRIIIISQTEPLPKDTNIQLFTIVDQCTSDDKFYAKIEGGIFPGPIP